jgi:hypothetical protein
MAFMEFVYFLIRKIYNKAVLNGWIWIWFKN